MTGLPDDSQNSIEVIDVIHRMFCYLSFYDNKIMSYGSGTKLFIIFNMLAFMMHVWLFLSKTCQII